MTTKLEENKKEYQNSMLVNMLTLLVIYGAIFAFLLFVEFMGVTIVNLIVTAIGLIVIFLSMLFAPVGIIMLGTFRFLNNIELHYFGISNLLILGAIALIVNSIIYRGASGDNGASVDLTKK